MKRTQYLVIGLGTVGQSIAETLYESGCDVMAVDVDQALVDAMNGRVTHAVVADAADPDALEAIDAASFDVAIVTIATDLRATVITMLLKEAGIPMVIAKASDEMHGRLLRRVGADQIIFPERDMGHRIARNLVSGTILDYIELSPDFSLIEIKPQPAWVGVELGVLNLRGKMGINVVAVRSGEHVKVDVGPRTVFRADDVLLVMGEQRTLEKLSHAR